MNLSDLKQNLIKTGQPFAMQVSQNFPTEINYLKKSKVKTFFFSIFFSNLLSCFDKERKNSVENCNMERREKKIPYKYSMKNYCAPKKTVVEKIIEKLYSTIIFMFVAICYKEVPFDKNVN